MRHFTNTTEMPQTKIYYLIGMMGVGKSSIGLGAARKLNITFVDLDDHIRKVENKSINEIFKSHGEQKFREMEMKYLRELDFDGAPVAIVSTGGGTPAFNDNMDFMNQNGRTIWFQTPVSEIVERLKDMKDDRPLINTVKNNMMEEQLKKIYEARLPIFEKANFILENVGYDYEVIEKLVDLITSDVETFSNK